MPIKGKGALDMGQVTHVFASQFSSQTGGKDLSRPHQYFGWRLKPIRFISLARMTLEKLCGDWTYDTD